MTRCAFFVAFLMLFLGGMLQASDVKSQDLRNTNVTLNLRNVTLEQVFNEIKRQSDLTFTYSPEVGLKPSAPINVKNMPVIDVFNKIQEESGVEFKQINRMIKVIPVIQEPGSLNGHIKDETGISMVGVTVQIKQTERPEFKTTTSDANGNFHFSDLKAGKTYDTQLHRI